MSMVRRLLSTSAEPFFISNAAVMVSGTTSKRMCWRVGLTGLAQ